MAMGADDAQQFYNLATQAEQYVRNGDHAEALHLFARIVASGDPDLGPHAALRVGALLADNDPSAAEASWRYAADQASGEIASAAGNNLTLLAQHTGRPVRVEPSSVAEVYGRAMLGRGRLLLNAGDLRAAGQAFEETVPCPHPDVSAEALVHLGATRAMQGDSSAALAALDRAVDSGHPHWSPLAAIDVAELLLDRDEHDNAVELLRWSASTDHPTARASAVSRLEALGEPVVAQETAWHAPTARDGGWQDASAQTPAARDGGWQDASALGTAGQDGAWQETTAQEAAARDGAWQEVAAREATARDTAAQEAAAGDGAGRVRTGAATSPQSAPSAAPPTDDAVGLVLIEGGPEFGTEPGGDPNQAGADAMRAGRQLLAQGDLTSALRTFEEAIDTGHPIHAPAGAAQLAHAFWQREGMSGAETGIGRLEDNGFPELAARGWFFLGKQLVAGGKFDDAEEALQKAADLPGDAQSAATCSLWVLDADLSNAEEVFGETVERTPDLATEVVGLAVDFGDVLRGQNDVQTSRTAYELAFHLAQRTGDDYLVAETRKMLTG